MRPGSDLESLALTKREWDVLQEFAYILSVSLFIFTYTHSQTHIVIVPPQRPTSHVWRRNPLAHWGYSCLRNIHKWMGETPKETKASCPIYSTRVGLCVQILFEDRPLEGLHHGNVCVYELVLRFTTH